METDWNSFRWQRLEVTQIQSKTFRPIPSGDSRPTNCQLVSYGLRLQRSMLTIGTKSNDRTQKLPRREAQTVRQESEHSSRNQPKKKQNQRLTLSWTEEDPEVQRWSSLKHSQQTYLEEICLLLLVITTIQCTFTLLCTQCVQVISLKTVRRTELPCTFHNNFKPQFFA